ncbi:MAG: hypothetical protein VX546_03960 [Myxococcota bacterium]|nr:hypothetical protein [Myxococcota bacterium]
MSTDPKATTSSASTLDPSGNCAASVGSNDLYPVTQVADLGAEFTPPFYPVAVESQSASVPMQIGWLLGGLLLGLGVKRAVGR